jgi:hypothetical protein
MIRTLSSFFIIKYLLCLNSPFSLSENIVYLLSILPISYPIIIPPIAGDKIKSNSLKDDLIFSASELHNLEALLGLLSN